MKPYRCILAAVVLLSLTAWGTLAAEPPVARQMQDIMNDTGAADFFVVLRDDLATQEISDTSAHIVEPGVRRQFIVGELKNRAADSQDDLARWLQIRGVDFQQFWIVNQILVKNGSSQLLQEIASRKDVERIDANPRVEIDLPESGAVVSEPAAPAGVEWGIATIKADQVWSQYGVRGEGIVVGIQDTGVSWTHEALQNQYRGWNGVSADHEASWHDAIHATSHGSSCGSDATAPCDDYDHGTHVAGTVVGHTPANQIGVAPGARWIACRCMDNGWGTPATYLECLQWFLAPAGDSSQSPDIINNSWSCPPSEGCSQATLESAVQTVIDAGIMLVASNGNQGPSCATTLDPPGLYRQSYSVGAADSGENLASFSSRGPVQYDGETYIKPDITAPGVNIRSSAKNGGYVAMSGTSMAAPHISGVIALLWSGHPGLRGKMDLTRQIFNSTAQSLDYTGCGDPPGVPNNGYGWGRVDVLAAYKKAETPSATPGIPLLLLE